MPAKRVAPSIKDVAQVAGVSFKSVSRVLNGEDGVSPELRNRVLAAVERVGYIANAGARSMRSGRTGVVGFLSDVITTTPFSFDIIRGAQDGLSARGLSMLIANTQNEPDRINRHLGMFFENRVEGIIYAAMFHREVVLPPIPSGMPVVMLNCFDRDSRYPAVVPDDELIGRTAAEYLIGKGHRRIAYLTLMKSIVATPLRSKGFKDALRQAGLPLMDITIRESRRFKANGTEISTAREIVEKLMADRDPPTAILAGNDTEAMPILGALQQRGLSVPGDVSVLGIDNFELICERMEPPLTSIGLPYYEMGKLAIERLFSQDAAGPLIERVPGPLVERDSVAAPRTGTISRQALRA